DVVRAEGEVAQDLLGVTRRFLQVQTLPQPVRADNLVVKRQPEFDNGVPADEAALSRCHLLAEHSAVAAAKQVDEAVACNGLGAEGGGLVKGPALAVEQLVQTGHRRLEETIGGRQGGAWHRKPRALRTGMERCRGRSRPRCLK